MKEKDNLIVDIVIYFNWDKMSNDYEYDQCLILEDALRFFPNSKSDNKDVRMKWIEIMEATSKDFSIVIQKEKQKSEMEGPLLECYFSFDNTNWIRGIFWRYAIRFFSKDVVSEQVKDKLVDFIKKHTPPAIFDEYFCDRESEENN